MKESIYNKLQNLADHFEEVGALLGDPEVISDQNRFRSLSQEYAQLNPVISSFREYKETLESMESAQEMLKDEEFRKEYEKLEDRELIIEILKRISRSDEKELMTHKDIMMKYNIHQTIRLDILYQKLDIQHLFHMQK